MAEKKNPEIRFEGFNDDWEQCKLSEIADIVGGGTPSTNNPEYWDGNIDWYAPAEIEGQRYAVGSVKKITELGLQKSSATMLPAGRTVLFTSRAGIGKMAILQHSAATNQGFQSIVLKDRCNPYFIYSMGSKIKKMAEGVASGSTFLEISGKMLGDLVAAVPSSLEQDKIASYFQRLDDLIALHQIKYEKLQNFKKAMLEKMFPKDGADVPEIRFKGFTDVWEQRTLGEIVKSHNAGVYIPKEKYGEGVNIIGVGNIYDSDAVDGKIFRFAPVYEGRFILDENDLIYGESSLVPEGIARTMYVTKNGSGTAFAWHTRRVKIDNDKCNSHIITLELNYQKDVRNYLMRASTQTALTGITTEGFFGATISYPSLKEQEKISAFFRNLDNLIALQQRKLEKLKNIKKTLLDKMFV